MLHHPKPARVSPDCSRYGLVSRLPTSVAAFALAALALTTLAAQEKKPAFTVASIKPSTASPTAPHRMDLLPGGVLRASNVAVARLIQYAYRRSPTSELRLDLVENLPAWTREVAFDIEAQSDEVTTAEKAAPMLRTLLEERFKLVTRLEPKPREVYVLRRKRNDRLGTGLQLRSQENCAQARANSVGGRVEFLPSPLSTERFWFGRPCAATLDLIGNLASLLRTDVTDETALTGSFDYLVPYPIDLSAEPDNSKQLYDLALVPAAVERYLGLTLARMHRPVPVLVITSVSRPTPN